MANAETELMAEPDTETAPTRWFQSDGGKVLIIGTGSVVIVLVLLAIGALAGFKIPPPVPDQPAAPTSSGTSAPAATSPAPATVAPAPVTTPAPVVPVSPKPAPATGPSTMTTQAPTTYTPPPTKQYTPPAGQAGTTPTATATATASSTAAAPANPPQMNVVRTTNGVARPIPGNS